jgi:hypothetical protein
MRNIRSWVLFGLLGSLALVKFVHVPPPPGPGSDSSYYFQVARHVAAGDGLVTSVSAYRQGLPHLPAPSLIYPLWPAVLGAVGAATDIDLAAMWLPRFLYLTALALLYVLGNDVARSWGSNAGVLSQRWPWVDVGHLLVVLFGTNPIFFGFTSSAFTEGLAFSLLFGCAIAVIRSLRRPHSLGWAIVAGALAGLAYLARTQFLPVLALVPAVLLVLGGRASWRPAAVAQLAALSLSVPWMIYMAGILDHFRPIQLADFALIHETPELPPFDWHVHSASWLGLLADRARGVRVAFDYHSEASYVRSFGLSAYLPVVALLTWWAEAARKRDLLSALTSSRAAGVVVCLALAAGPLAALHMTHADRYGGWFFSFRQGLPLVLVIAAASAYLLARGSASARAVALAILLHSSASGALEIRSAMINRNDSPAMPASNLALAHWIDARAGERMFLSTRALALGAETHGRFHEVICDAEILPLATYASIGVDTVIMYAADSNCASLELARPLLNEIARFGAGLSLIQVFELPGRSSQ